MGIFAPRETEDIMVTSTAHVVWNGSLTEGGGQISAQSGAFEAPYSLKSRQGAEPKTNPEELIGAAHASCYTMMVTALLTKNGTPPGMLRTRADVSLDTGGGAFTIAKIHLTVEGEVPGVEEAKFLEIAEQAKKECPVSRALAGVQDISLDAKLLAVSK